MNTRLSQKERLRMGKQHKRLMDLLRSYNGAVVPLPKILDLHISQYGRVINDLRKKHGINIKSEFLGVVNGERHTGFRLIEDKGSQLSFL